MIGHELRSLCPVHSADPLTFFVYTPGKGLVPGINRSPHCLQTPGGCQTSHQVSSMIAIPVSAAPCPRWQISRSLMAVSMQMKRARAHHT